jgi:hypothetical protein
MNTRRNQRYLAHRCPPFHTESEAGDCTAGIQPENAAEYIATHLCSLRALAINAELAILSDLLSVAEEEAKFHCRM